ncbi:MAG TPA: winged helix-turn-helix domain-containing protein, partial [Trebonia sp.]|nr:winged helix-turn-helix domain-containing protein [Trebonia sp.]
MTGSTPAAPATKRGRGLAELILAESGRAGLMPGSRLPTERRLAADLGVSRSGIRLALAALEADGLISREVGRGTFLRDAAASALAAARPGEPAAAADGQDSGEASPR